MTVKDIDKQTLSELIRGYEERIAELEGNKQGCEMRKDEDGINGHSIISLYETNIIADYCPFCGRKLVQT